MVQVNDLRNNFVHREEILRTKFTFSDINNCYGTINNDGGEIVIGIGEGHVLIPETGNGITSNTHKSTHTATGSEWKLTVLQGHNHTVHSVVMSADGTLMVSG